MTTPHLNMPELAASQSQKHVTHNEALALLDAIVQLSVIDNSLTAPPGAPAESDRYIVAATATGDWAGWEGSIALFTGGVWVKITPANGWVVWVETASLHYGYNAGWTALINEAPSDGTAYARKDGGWVVVSVTGGVYDLGLAFQGTPVTTEVMGKLWVPREVSIPADFAGSGGDAGTNPTAAFDIDVRDDAVSIGTVSIATDGTFTFATAGGTAKTIAAGSLITFIAPVAVDATITDIVFTLKGDV